MLTLTDLPHIMQDKEHWPVAAACLRRWLQNGALQESEAVRAGDTQMNALPVSQFETNILKMDWALSFHRVKIAHDQLIGEIWRDKKGLERLIKLAHSQVINPSARRTPSGGWIFGDPFAPVKNIDTTAQVNFIKVGAMTDPLDDFYGAVGRAILKVAAFGYIDIKSKNLHLTIDRLGVYLRDTYDFNGEQWLGIWSDYGVDKNSISEVLGWKVGGRPGISIDRKIGADDNTEYAVTNKDFRLYRTKYGRGGDYINVSNVRIVTLSQPQVFVL